MTDIQVLAVSARTVSLLLCPPGTRFALPEPVRWTLLDEQGVPLGSGTQTVCALFLDGLSPDSGYRLETSIGTLDFVTEACAGLVEAGDHGVSTDAADNAQAFSRAVAAVPDGGTLRVGPGRYPTGPVFLKPRMTLLLEDGAELYGIADRSGWPKLDALDPEGRVLGTWEGVPERCFAALVTAVECDGLTITGRGTIDGGGDRGDWWSWPKETRDGARRPRALQLIRCHEARLTGLTVRNAPSWTVHPVFCRSLHVSNLRIENPPDSPNTDGLNPESCEGGEIACVDFSVGDDCIAVKAGKRVPGGNNAHLAPCRDLNIHHCRMARGHGAVVLGSEMSGGIEDVTVHACAFDATDRGLRIKTRRGRGGFVRRVRFSDVAMTDVPTPLAVNAFYFCDADGKDDRVQSRAPAPRDAGTPEISDITFTDVTATGVTVAAAAVLGLPEAPVQGLTLIRYRVSFDANAAPDVPLMALHVPELRNAALWSDFAEVAGAPEIMNEREEAPC